MFSRRVKPRFDKRLRERHPAWGIGLLADLLAQAELADLQVHERRDMAAINLLLVFRWAWSKSFMSMAS